VKTAYRLFRLRKDGTIDLLFIGRTIVVPEGKWIKARAIRNERFRASPWMARGQREERERFAVVGDARNFLSQA
jgi:hypothetical protein